jgi:hypothetical protein
MTSYRIVIPAFALALMVSYPGTQKSFAAAAPEPAAFGQDRWEMPPGEFNDIQRRGFHDGIEGARKDYGNRRNPDVNNREEYRNCDLPRDIRHVYKEAFRQGYEMAASHLWNGPQPPPPPVAVVPPPPGRDWDQDWDRWGMRGLRNDAERRGYRDGLEEARSDVQFNRNTDPDDQPQFRNPPVPPPMADEYREGFMRGYEVAISQLQGGRPWEGRDNDMDHWAPPERFSEWQRQGFHDGIDGARKDYGNNRRPSVFNRWEYQNPRVPPPFIRNYRRGFRRGYEMAASRLWSGM